MKYLWSWIRVWWYVTTHICHVVQIMRDGLSLCKRLEKLSAQLIAAQDSEQEVLEQLDQCLRALGQMKHLDKHPGIMTMDVTKRSTLCDTAGQVFSRAFIRRYQ